MRANASFDKGYGKGHANKRRQGNDVEQIGWIRVRSANVPLRHEVEWESITILNLE
jgi:hypothetical protein